MVSLCTATAARGESPAMRTPRRAYPNYGKLLTITFNLLISVHYR
jgi:hypothetical protein